MFEYYNNKLCVQGGWLYGESAIMSQNNFRRLSRLYFNTIRRACKNTPALIEFESIPERFRKVIIDQFGDPYATTKHIQFKDYLEFDTKAADYFKNYTLDNGEALPERNIKEYIANSIILNAVQKLTTNAIARRKALGGNQSKVWHKIAEIIQDLPKHTYPHSLPKNVRRLKQKNKTYLIDGYLSLIHKGFCNKNSEKINDDAKYFILSRWADRVNKIATIAQLHEEYNELAAIEGWKLLKEKDTIYNYLNQEHIKNMWWGYRYGELKAKEKYTYHHSTKMPTMRDSLWYSDGTKLNYYYQDENGKTATCQVYEVMDAFSEVFLGYHISKTEDYEAQYFAYKMAAQTAGHKPYQIGFDNQGGHKKLEAGEFLTKIARLSIKTQPYNGKSKTIESAFGRFQQQFLKREWFFTGMNITTKKNESKANMEFILANKKNLPTLTEIKEIYKKRREEWNNAPHHQTGVPRSEMYRSSSNPKTPKIEMWDMVDLFWILREKPVTVTPYGISFKEKKSEFNYMVYSDNRMPNLDFLKNNIDKKVFIKFDPQDMSMIYLYEKDALGLRFITAAETKIEIHRGKQEQEDWENSWLTEVNENNKKSRLETVNKMDSILEAHGATPEQKGLNSPKISGIKSTYKKRGKKAVQSNIGKHLKEESNLVAVENDDLDQSIYNKY